MQNEWLKSILGEFQGYINEVKQNAQAQGINADFLDLQDGVLNHRAVLGEGDIISDDTTQIPSNERNIFGNVIYFVVTNDDNTEMKSYGNEIIRRANIEFGKLGLKTRVALYNGKGDLRTIGKKEGIVFFGSVDKVKSRAKAISFKFAKILETWKGGRNPEQSSLGTKYSEYYADGMNLVAIDAEAISKGEGMWGRPIKDPLLGAFILMHGVGHNAQNFSKEELDDILKRADTNHFGGIMADGDRLYTYAFNGGDIVAFMNPYLAEHPYYHDEDSPPTIHYWRAAVAGGREDPFSPFYHISVEGEQLIKKDYRRYPNITYIYMMNKYFGTAEAKVNPFLGTIL